MSHLKKEDLSPELRAKGVKNISGLRMDKGRIALIFADLEFTYKGKDKKGKSAEKKFSVHRAYEPSFTGGFDEVRTPYASGHYWDESYAPNFATYTNLKNQQHLAVRLGESLRRSVYFLTNFSGVLVKHHFEFGAESCE